MIFPEFIVGDEGKTGKAGNRVGLNTLKSWSVAKQILVIVAFSVSRWFGDLAAVLGVLAYLDCRTK